MWETNQVLFGRTTFLWTCFDIEKIYLIRRCIKNNINRLSTDKNIIKSHRTSRSCLHDDSNLRWTF